MAVLLIDPDVASAERLARALRPAHTCAVVASAHDAWAAIRMWTPNLIVTEIDLPDASGLDLVARLRGDPATRHTLFMIVTRRTSLGDKISGFQVGADDYLVKPVGTQQFVLHVQSVSRFRQVLPGGPAGLLGEGERR
jgi:DNA-binding response OmpR family regulator